MKICVICINRITTTLKGYMKILKLIGFVVLLGCILLSVVNSANGETTRSGKSNIQVSDLQTQKKTSILSRLNKSGLISTKIKKLRKDKQDDVVCLALNIYHEARGSTEQDRIASSYVAFNRWEDSNYPLTLRTKERSLCNIIFDRYQFCWTNDSYVKLPKEKTSWENAQELAYELYTNPIHKQLAKDFALQHYVVTPLVYAKGRPKWINKRTMTTKIGDHSYMSLVKGINAKVQANKSQQAINKAIKIIHKTESKKLKPLITKIK